VVVVPPWKSRSLVAYRTPRVVFDIAAAKNAKPGQIALASRLHKGGRHRADPGTKRRVYLEENASAEAIRLDPANCSSSTTP